MFVLDMTLRLSLAWSDALLALRSHLASNTGKAGWIGRILTCRRFDCCAELSPPCGKSCRYFRYMWRWGRRWRLGGLDVVIWNYASGFGLLWRNASVKTCVTSCPWLQWQRVLNTHCDTGAPHNLCIERGKSRSILALRQFNRAQKQCDNSAATLCKMIMQVIVYLQEWAGPLHSWYLPYPSEAVPVTWVIQSPSEFLVNRIPMDIQLSKVSVANRNDLS